MRESARRVDPGMTQDTLLRLLSDDRSGVLVTLKRDSRPPAVERQPSLLSRRAHRPDLGHRRPRQDPQPAARPTGVVPRVHPDRLAYTVVEGTADLSPVAKDPHDDTVEELIRLYRDVLGEHPDWDDYRAAMVRDRRLVVRLRVERAYGIPKGANRG